MPELIEKVIVVIGNKDTGKTSLLERVCNNKFTEDYDRTIGFNLNISTSLNKKFSYKIWDMGAYERFGEMYERYSRDCDILLLAINPLDEEFDKLKNKLFGVLEKSTTTAGYLLIFTKRDLWEKNEKIELRVKTTTLEFLELQLKSLTRAALMISAKSPTADEIKTFSTMLNQLINNPVNELIERLKTYKQKSENRLLNRTHSSRSATIRNLNTVLLNVITVQEQIDALIAAASDIQQLDAEGKPKYGFTIFDKHFGSYKDSSLYKWIKKELYAIAPEINLEKVSKPEIALAASQPGTHDDEVRRFG
jgi:GTPase SAR1 family protein